MQMTDDYHVPHLTTALSGPLLEIETKFLKHSVEIESWFRKQWQQTPPPITCSVDLRNAGFKVAPIDTNLFPAGFNNLNPSFLPMSIQAAQSSITRLNPPCDNILLVIENHTRNEKYFSSVGQLADILVKAGYAVRIGSLREDLTEPETINFNDTGELTIHPIKRDGCRITVDNFCPCIIVLNNDLSTGIPEILKNISQPIHPPIELGWSTRLKSQHFNVYKQVAEEFAKQFDLDPWLINPYFCTSDEIDFMAKEGLEQLAGRTENILNQVKEKYQQYGITQEPFVIIKADSGTYGMAVMQVKSADDVLSLNRKQRTHMSTAKGKRSVSKVIIQEGVYSFETLGEDKAVAEPVIYMMGHHVIGGFYRVHKNRGPDENLNSPGMVFEPLAFAETCNYPDTSCDPDDCYNRFYVYGVIGRLALLAAAREIDGGT